MTPVTALPPAAQRTCPQCQSPLTTDQEWCLNCGAAVGARVVRSPNWKLPLAVAALIIVLCGAALAFALVEVFGGDDSTSLVSNPTTTTTPTTPANVPVGPTTPPADIGPTGASGPTGPSATTGPDGPSGPDIPPVTEPPPATEPPASEPPPATDTASVGSWPSGEEAYTVILESSPSRSGAQRVAQRLADGGTDVGVLNSSDFSSLNGGYWVVFSGQFDSEDEAAEKADDLRSTAPGAYPRLVRP
jgi:type IV secretory pathway VirB10-like protein